MATNVVNLRSTSGAKILKEGTLFKRQRGRKPGRNLKLLKFQQRYCVLSSDILEYFNSKRRKESHSKPSGNFQVAKVKLVEKVPETTFTNKQYCFQVGCEKEVLYFCASLEQERTDWIDALRKAAFQLGKNRPLPMYHLGAFGLKNTNKWSCCEKFGREAEGCEHSTSPPPTIQRRESMPSSTTTTIIRQDFASKSLPNDRSGERDSGLFDQVSDDSDGYDTDEPERRISSEPLVLSTYHQPSKQNAHSLHQSGVNSQADCPLVFAHNDTIQIDDDGFGTSVVYRGADSLITATNTGKVSLISKLNTSNHQKEIVFVDTNENSLSIGIRGKKFVVGSSNLHFDTSKALKRFECFDNFQDKSPKLVAFSPDGSLFIAGKGGCTVDMICLDENDLPAKKIVTVFEIPHGQIFSLLVSPHPNHPWLAVGFTSLQDERKTDFVSFFNYKSKNYSKPGVPIGRDTKPCLAFTHDGRYLYVGDDVRIQCFYTDTSRPTKFKYTLQEDNSITSMCCSPVRHHLAVGLKSGAVRVFMGDPSLSATTPHIITDTKNNGAVTSLSYSRDGMKTAIAFENGSVQIWKASRPPEERALTRTGTLEVTDKGQTYHSTEDGYTITIPEGAVKPGTVVHLHYGVAPNSPYGPYEFEDGARPVSAIISLCPEPAFTEFLKPIEVTLTHFIVCRTQQDCENLSFYKAHDNFRVESGTIIYRFEEVTDDDIAHFTKYYEKDGNQKIAQGAATLYAKSFCDICIARKYSEEETSRAWLSLSQIVPRKPNLSQEYEVYYCLAYFLETCIKRVAEQYPDELYIKEERVVSFPKEPEEHEKVLQLNTTQEGLKGGWQLSIRPSQHQIAEDDVCFWSDDIIFNIQELVQKKLYPPKISLRVHPGEMVREGVVTTISFSGVNGMFKGTATEFSLELIKPSGAAISPSSRKSFSPVSFQSALSPAEPAAVNTHDFQECCYKIASEVDCKRLALAIYSASSQNKCPYLKKPTIEKLKTFLLRARTSDSTKNFDINFDIIVEIIGIATEFPEYESTVQTALDGIPRKYSFSSQSPLVLPESRKESISVGYDTSFADEGPPNVTPFTGISPNYSSTNEHLPQLQSFTSLSPHMNDPSPLQDPIELETNSN